MTEPTLYPESGFLRLRIDLAYDGTNFSGWAVQPDRRTVQEEVEKALTTATQSKIETIVAGRTDAGVHATGQVIHVDVPDTLNLDDLSYKLNRMLDTDVRVMGVSIAPPAFHARFSALSRQYVYLIQLSGIRRALLRNQVTFTHKELDAQLESKEPMEVTKEARSLVMRIPLEGGGRLVVELNPQEANNLSAALHAAVALVKK